MSFLFKQPKLEYATPTLEPLPAVKSPADMEAEATAKAKADELERRKRAKGFRSTILTSGEEQALTGTLLTKQLLGE